MNTPFHRSKTCTPSETEVYKEPVAGDGEERAKSQRSAMRAQRALYAGAAAWRREGVCAGIKMDHTSGYDSITANAITLPAEGNPKERETPLITRGSSRKRWDDMNEYNAA